MKAGTFYKRALPGLTMPHCDAPPAPLRPARVFDIAPAPRMGPEPAQGGATWRNGDAADCKSVYTGSIPVVASNGAHVSSKWIGAERALMRVERDFAADRRKGALGTIAALAHLATNPDALRRCGIRQIEAL